MGNRSGAALGRGKAAPGADRRKEIGIRLRKVRTARGLSQEDVAEACEVTRAAVSQWEKGIALAEMANLERAADRLNCSVEWLRTGNGSAPQVLELPPKLGHRRALRYANFVDSGAWSRRPDEPPFDGAIAEIESGVGSGVPYTRGEDVFDWWRFPPGYLQEDLRTKSSSLRIFRVQSDSMEPIIRRGSFVMVDASQTVASDGKIFAINNGISVVLKRLVIKPDADDKWVGLKDGTETGEVHRVPLKKLKIFGRCIMRIDNL
jgi:phage repressor protein C with HTH and peptisase S24 domain